MTSTTYVDQRDDGGYWIKDTRVSLDSVVYRFIEGLSPKSIQADCFPTLTLEQVYSAITCYLHNRAAVDAYLQQTDAEYEQFRKRVRAEYPQAHRRLDRILQDAPALRS